MEETPVSPRLSLSEEPQPGPSVTANTQGKHVHSGQRLMAYNVFIKHLTTNSKTQSIKLTSSEVGLSERILWQIVSAKESSVVLKSPPRKRVRQQFVDKLDEDDKKAIRRIVHSFFLKNELPNLNKITEVSKIFILMLHCLFFSVF